MPNYLVTWRIDSEGADNPEAAALEAFLAVQGNDTQATVYEVRDKATNEVYHIDLDVSELMLD